MHQVIWLLEHTVLSLIIQYSYITIIANCLAFEFVCKNYFPVVNYCYQEMELFLRENDLARSVFSSLTTCKLLQGLFSRLQKGTCLMNHKGIRSCHCSTCTVIGYYIPSRVASTGRPHVLTNCKR